MAKVKVKKEKRMVFTLNQREVEYLAGLTQNYIGGKNLSDESPKDIVVRKGLHMCFHDAAEE